MSDEQIKATAYDQLVIKANAERNIQVLEMELQKRNQAKPEEEKK